MNAFAMILILAPPVLWLVAELKGARAWLRVLSGILAMSMISLFTYTISSIKPAYERGFQRMAMQEVERNLKAGNTGLVESAVAEYNRTAATGDIFVAVGRLRQALAAPK
jgi:hypothetical protein